VLPLFLEKGVLSDLELANGIHFGDAIVNERNMKAMEVAAIVYISPDFRE
jgi:hypothetical protein